MISPGSARTSSSAPRSRARSTRSRPLKNGTPRRRSTSGSLSGALTRGSIGVAQTRRVRILLTGFEPFAGRGVNPSWDAAQQLDGASAGPGRIDALRLPVVWRESVAVIQGELEREPAAGLVIGGPPFGPAALHAGAPPHAARGPPPQGGKAGPGRPGARSAGREHG